MKEINLLPDEKLEYISHEINEGTLLLFTRAMTNTAICPYCNKQSDKVHSRYTRKLQDLPIQGRKVKIILEINKYFCHNKKCRIKTFAESFSFFEPKATKTKRLQEEIIKVSLTQSSISAAKYLKGSVANVGKSTICNLLKKTRTNS